MIIEYHGGGALFLDYWVVQGYCCKLAVENECIIANIDYRLAPEYPTPKGFEDAVAAIKYFHSNSGKYGVDENYISIQG